MRMNLDVLQCIASQIQQENSVLNDLTRQSQKDSRTLKILSIVATMYLPASLVAVRDPVIFGRVEVNIYRRSSVLVLSSPRQTMSMTSPREHTSPFLLNSGSLL